MKNQKESLPSNIESEVTEEQWRDLITKGDQYLAKIKENRNAGSMSYKHVMGNLAAIFTEFKLSAKTDELYKKISDVITYMDRYFKLLEDFPDFANKELKGEDYFPEICSKLSDSRELVDAYEVELRNK